MLMERLRHVQPGLPTYRRQERIGPFLRDDGLQRLERDRLDVGCVGQFGIGHDRRRVRVDQHHTITFGVERLDRLRAGIIKLGGLTDHDRAGADDEYGVEVGSFWHF